MLYEEPVGDDSDSDVVARKRPQRHRSAIEGLEFPKEVALSHRKTVKRFVSTRSAVDTPFGQAVTDVCRQCIGRDSQPLGRYRSKAAIKIRTDAVQVDSENESGRLRSGRH